MCRLPTDQYRDQYFSVTSKTLPNKDIIATVKDAVKDLEKEEADTICAKVSLTLQNSKPSKDNLSNDERKALKELQSDKSIIILPVDKGRSTVILNRDFINNKLYYLKPTDSPAPRFYGQQKSTSQELLYVVLFHIVTPHCTISTNT